MFCVVFFLFFFFWFSLLKSICCGYSFELHQQVSAIQMCTHNICLYRVVDKKYTGWYLKTTELLDCVLIGACAVIRLIGHGPGGVSKRYRPYCRWCRPRFDLGLLCLLQIFRVNTRILVGFLTTSLSNVQINLLFKINLLFNIVINLPLESPSRCRFVLLT